jgi:D-alanine transfer protein
VVVAGVAAAARYAHQIEQRHVHAVAPQMFAQKNQGVALQRAAFRAPDLLPLYGSSDVNVPNRFHASALFRDYPTGFSVFPVGAAGSTNLIWLQALAAVGSAVRGKKVAVSLSARPFMTDRVDQHVYAASFSHRHASALAFSSELSFAVKQSAARRMLEYPTTLTGAPVLRFALERLADGSFASRMLYYLSMPLGKVQNGVLRLQDAWETIVFLRAQLGLGPVRREPASLDWVHLLRRAEQDSESKAGNNPFGFESAFWARHAPDIAMQKGIYASRAVRHDMERSAEWADFELLLRTIAELGGEPLILNIPMNGAYYDHLGVPWSTRSAYYEKLRAVTGTYGVRLVDFAERDADKYFTVDSSPHLSGKGWMYFNSALDAFYHDRQPGNP